MQSRQNRDRDDSVTVRNVMAIRARALLDRRVGNAGPEARMGPSVVGMRHPSLQDNPDVSFIQRDHPIQALPTDGADQPVAECIRLWAAHGRFQDRQAVPRQYSVQ